MTPQLQIPTAQLIHRLAYSLQEARSYEGHSLGMMRRVANV